MVQYRICRRAAALIFLAGLVSFPYSAEGGEKAVWKERAERLNLGKSGVVSNIIWGSIPKDIQEEAGGAARPKYFKWPVPGGRFGRGFGSGKDGKHKALDIVAPKGTPVLAATYGLVIWAASKSGYGKTIIILHPGGWVTLYAHLSKYYVHTGMKVAARKKIGAVGNTGISRGPHLHFMWYDNGVLRDPAPLMHPSIPHPPHVYPMPYLGHTVKKGQTPKEIADLYGVEVEKLLAINGMKPSETLHAGWRIIIPKKIKQKKYAKGLYKVKKGDTLAAIAVLYDVKVAELQALNGIDDPDLIKPGTRIKLPKGVYSGKAMEPIGGGDDGPGKEGYKKYVVKEGDSLFSIAKKFKSSIKKIAAANGISNPDMIKPDMKLLVPYEKKKHSKAGHGKKKKKKSGIKKEGKETEELGDDEGAGHGEEEPDEEGEEGSGDEAEDGEEPGPEETGGGREDGGGAGSGDQDVIPAKEKVMELKRIGGSKSKNMEVYVIE